jgi:hypothetical protein
MTDQSLGNDDPAAVSTTTTSETSVFLEHDAAFQLIDLLTECGVEHLTAEMDSGLADLRGIFDKYLELPSLLDKYVERMVNQLATAARLFMDDPAILEGQKFWASSLPRIFSALYALSKVSTGRNVLDDTVCG